MEAVPRLPMYFFELKVSPDRPPTEFGQLKQYIRDLYNEDPETYSTEIRNLETLRAQAVHPVKDINGCSILKKYYCQLHFLESRFPLSKDGPVSFTWRDIYSGTVYTVNDIKSEIVAILYNIGALHSHMGASDDRTTPEGLKMACTHFQCAAWAFQHIKDSYPQASGLDVSPDLMQFMYHLCLAQAQECILEKSMTDNRKATINARVATQIVDYYNLAQNALLQGGSNDDNNLTELVSSKLMKNWKKYVRFKATYYTCVSLLYQGMQSEEQQKMGERVAYFQAALDKLNEAIKLSKGLDQAEAITESLLFTRDVVEGKRKAAKSENEFIYHEEVVDIDSLPSIKGASLVKGISFNINDPDISGPDIFARLVPMKAHEASSLYSEEKAKILRRINGLIDSKDEEVVSYMSCLQLDHLKAHLQPDTLPQEVVDRCAALSVKPDAIPNLIAAMDKLNGAYHDVDAMLQEIMQLIKTEEKNEKEYQEMMGSRAPSIVATDLTREANKYMEAHKKAADSNETLNRAMSQHVENLRVLQQSLPELQAQLPTLAPLNLNDNDSLKEVTMLVDKVDEMRKQRAMLASQLRESICSDDITAILVTRDPENTEQLFQQELKKHDKYVNLIEQNLSAQENILKALTDAYARYAPTRKATSDIIKQRELMLSALISSYDAYEDLLAKSSKGMEFYRKLETNLTKLLQRVKGTCRVQQEEREAILVKNNLKINPEPVASQEVSSGGPKLKDYLQKRKEAQSLGGSYPVAPVNHNWLPGVRPAPVGSEVTQPLINSNKPQEYSIPVNTYPGNPSNQYQLPYSGYYGQNLPVNYPPRVQYSSVTDSAIPVDSNPTAPYRPDSRASTCSDHSVSSQGRGPVAPTSLSKLSPEHNTSINNSTQISTQGQQTSNQPFPQSQLSGGFPQGHQYPGNYSMAQPGSNSAYTPQPNVPPNNSTVITQPSNVSIIQVNSESSIQSTGPQPANVQTIQVSGGHNTGQLIPSQPLSDGKTLNYYDPSHAKAMNVPSASYNGPYGYNTTTSPYANYYTSQMYNGNVSSSDTDKTCYPLHSTGAATLPAEPVYSTAESTLSNYSPSKIHQIPTTTYTVPANQQASVNQAAKTATPTSAQPYAVPLLVSPTQATYSILNSHLSQQQPESTSNQPAGQNVYAGQTTAVAQSSTNPSQLTQNASKVSGQPQTNFSQYSNYYYNNSLLQYPGTYYQTGQAYPGSQVNSASNPYPSAHPQYNTYSNYSTSYPPGGNQPTLPSTSQSSQTNYFNSQQYNQPSQSYPPSVGNAQQSPGGTYPQSQNTVSQPSNSTVPPLSTFSQGVSGGSYQSSVNVPQHPAGTYPQPLGTAQPASMTSHQAVGTVPQSADGSYPQATGSVPQHPAGGYPQSTGTLSQSTGGYSQAGGAVPQPTVGSYSQTVGTVIQPSAGNYSQGTGSFPQSTPGGYPHAAGSASQPVAGSYLQATGNVPQQFPGGNYPQTPGNMSQPTSGSYSQLAGSYNQSNPMLSHTNQTIPQQQQTGYIQTSPQNFNYIQPPSNQTGVQPYNYQGGYYNNTLQSQTGQTVQPQVPYQSSAQSQTTVTQSSNLDLLAGLDFTLSDAPLEPLPPSTSVSQISNSLSNISLESKPKDSHSVNGETKPQLERIEVETKKEEKPSLVTTPCVKSEENNSKPVRDPFTDSEALSQFVQDVDKFEKFVEGLCAKTLSGPTPLDIKWNELQDLQEKDAHRQNISVARCYPMKNRFPDILPYDNSTVELPSTKDDYINASFAKNLCSGCPDFILTQAPLPSTYADFWTMILEQHVELVVCLLSDSQMNGEIYWPENKTKDLIFDQLKISLQSCNSKSFWVERIISVSNSKTSRVIVHLQFTAWPNSWFPESPGPWLQLVGETLSVWKSCRNTESCIVIHCDSGVGRSGLFVVTAVALSDMLLSPHIPDIVTIASKLAMWRKNPLRDRDHLKFAYQTILYYCQDILMKRGILSNKGTFEEKRPKTKSHTRHPSQDFLLNTSHNTSSEERRHSDASSTGSRMSEIDPLNQLDPLWQIKRPS